LFIAIPPSRIFLNLQVFGILTVLVKKGTTYSCGSKKGKYVVLPLYLDLGQNLLAERFLIAELLLLVAKLSQAI
jgi:hypothetical protein